MLTSTAQTDRQILLRAPGHDHLVQFYDDDQFLVDALTQFIAPGLLGNEGAVIIGTEAHRGALEDALRREGVPTQMARQSGQLVMLDAEELLGRFVVGGMPDATRFNEIVGSLLGGLEQRYRRVRAFGEMVDLLWSRGQHAATLVLENLWNQAAAHHRLTLLCGYRMQRFAEPGHAPGFDGICQAHTHVLHAEDFEAEAETDDRRRQIARLQQQARALRTELARHQDTTAALTEALHQRDEFLSIAGHELKTPLTAVRLQLSILQRELARTHGPSDEKLRRAAEVCESQVRRLGSLVDEVLDVSRIRAGQLELRRDVVDLVELCRKSISHCESLSEASIRLEADGPVVGTWDSGRLGQVVTNLLGNAIKYGLGKPVSVGVFLDDESGCARVSVTDQGIGIAPEDQLRIFSRFERATSADNYAGLGLGLFIARQIVEAHGGSLSVTSVPGSGSTFTARLPTG